MVSPIGHGQLVQPVDELVIPVDGATVKQIRVG